MNDLEVRQLRYFVAVAEELHFGRAAGRLGMAQPPLSRAIRDLERQLGVVLLERTTRQVRLTTAGEVLLRDARTALEAVTAAARRTRQAGSPSPRLRVALKADVDGGLLPQILDAYCADNAALPPELVLGGFGEQPQALREGRADVGLLLRPFDDHGLDSEPLLTEPLLAALAAADPLAADAAAPTWPVRLPRRSAQARPPDRGQGQPVRDKRAAFRASRGTTAYPGYRLPRRSTRGYSFPGYAAAPGAPLHDRTPPRPRDAELTDQSGITKASL